MQPVPPCAHRMCSSEISGPSVVPPVRTGFGTEVTPGGHLSSTDGPPGGCDMPCRSGCGNPGTEAGGGRMRARNKPVASPRYALVCAFLRFRGARSHLARGELEPCFGAPKASPSPGHLGTSLVTSLGTLMGECRKERGLAASFCARGGVQLASTQGRGMRGAPLRKLDN